MKRRIQPRCDRCDKDAFYGFAGESLCLKCYNEVIHRLSTDKDLTS